MPKWHIHNKWAKKLLPELSESDLNFVNKLIDDPKSIKEFLDFYCDTSKWYHEWKSISPKFPLSEEGIKCTLSDPNDRLNRRMITLLLQVHHDSGRSKSPLGGSRFLGLAAFIQLRYLTVKFGLKSSAYIKAWYLHHLMDLTESSIYGYGFGDAKEIIKRIEERTKVPEFTRSEFEEVKNFFEKNFTQITNDIYGSYNKQ